LTASGWKRAIDAVAEAVVWPTEEEIRNMGAKKRSRLIIERIGDGLKELELLEQAVALPPGPDRAPKDPPSIEALVCSLYNRGLREMGESEYTGNIRELAQRCASAWKGAAKEKGLVSPSTSRCGPIAVENASLVAVCIHIALAAAGIDQQTRRDYADLVLRHLCQSAVDTSGATESVEAVIENLPALHVRSSRINVVAENLQAGLMDRILVLEKRLEEATGNVSSLSNRVRELESECARLRSVPGVVGGEGAPPAQEVPAADVVVEELHTDAGNEEPGATNMQLESLEEEVQEATEPRRKQRRRRKRRVMPAKARPALWVLKVKAPLRAVSAGLGRAGMRDLIVVHVGTETHICAPAENEEDRARRADELVHRRSEWAATHWDLVPFLRRRAFMRCKRRAEAIEQRTMLARLAGTLDRIDKQLASLRSPVEGNLAPASALPPSSRWTVDGGKPPLQRGRRR
jgi:hypothetical protein